MLELVVRQSRQRTESVERVFELDLAAVQQFGLVLKAD